MEDQEKIQPEDEKEEVEAHGRRGGGRSNPHASDTEPKQEGEDEGDFELHGRRGGGRSNPH